MLSPSQEIGEGPRMDYWAMSKPGKHFRKSSELARHFIVKPSQPDGDLAITFYESHFISKLRPDVLCALQKKSSESTASSLLPTDIAKKEFPYGNTENSLDLSEIESQKESFREDSISFNF